MSVTPHRADAGGRLSGMEFALQNVSLLALEIFFIGLLILATLVIAGISWTVVSRLYKGQR
ncbi:hypothetical protein GCM10009674_19770 [Nesterenkonia xinjiangensis]